MYAVLQGFAVVFNSLQPNRFPILKLYITSCYSQWRMMHLLKVCNRYMHTSRGDGNTFLSSIAMSFSNQSRITLRSKKYGQGDIYKVCQLSGAN